MNFKQMEKKVQKHMDAVAKQRDALDDAISEMEQLREDCREAYSNLQDARDALSRIV